MREEAVERAVRALHVSATDGGGGAGRAASRLHEALLLEGGPGVDSRLLVARKGVEGLTRQVEMLEAGIVSRQAVSFTRRVLDQDVRLGTTPNPIFRSSARLPTSGLRRIRDLDPDIVVLHWLGSRMLSIEQIGRINQPLVWVLHDSWLFCGAEHHPMGDGDVRFIEGYLKTNRNSGERGVDLNRRAWNRKRRHWTRPMHLVAPSAWIADQAKRSLIAGHWPTSVIPNPLNVSWWSCVSRESARAQLGISPSARVVLFGAIGGDRNLAKGADLLYSALTRISPSVGAEDEGSLQILTFGGKRGSHRVGPHLVRSVGHLRDLELRTYYSAADAMVVPSRVDNLPQTAVESIVCGTPVVAFRTGGLADIVDDGVTGRLAEPFHPESLAAAITWVLESQERRFRLSHAARSSAVRWEPARIAARYLALFQEILAP